MSRVRPDADDDIRQAADEADNSGSVWSRDHTSKQRTAIAMRMPMSLGRSVAETSKRSFVPWR